MAISLPNSTKLLGRILSEKPHTRDGQIRAFEMVQDLVNRCNLGAAEIFMYPVEEKHSDGEKYERDYPFLKIQSEFGASADKKDETILLPGHGDTVGLKGEQKRADALVIKDEKGYGRGTLDMWGGNVAYLHALQLLRDSGQSRRNIQTILTTREEAGSEILQSALKDGKIDPYDAVITTEITTHEDGNASSVYHARTGRFGYDVYITGEDAHAGMADVCPEILEHTPLRGTGRTLDHSLDQDPKRYCSIKNSHPNDFTGVLPKESRILCNKIIANPEGLSLPEVYMHFNVFHSNPDLAAEEVRSYLEAYLQSDLIKIPPECLSVRLEERKGVPFTEPWLTAADHPLIVAAYDIAKKVSGNASTALGAASGVAEDGRFSEKPVVGWACDGKDSHKQGEYVVLDTIDQRAEWIAQLASFDGSLTERG